jgi:hypothetical protein
MHWTTYQRLLDELQPHTLKFAQKATRAFAGADAQQAMKLAREAAGALSGLDATLIPSAAETFIGIDAKKSRRHDRHCNGR